jgi:hypothetical protein
MQLERAQMSGLAGEATPGLAGWVEESVRRVLRKAALGELGADLNEAADETLIATGLDTGDASIAVAEEIDPGQIAEQIVEPDPEPTLQADRSRGFHRYAGETSTTVGGEPTTIEDEEEHDMTQDTRILEPVPAEDEIRITARDWMEEVEEEGQVSVEESTLDFPAVADDLERRERIDTPRVRHLFPVPEDADWEVKELKYDHYRHRAG